MNTSSKRSLLVHLPAGDSVRVDLLGVDRFDHDLAKYPLRCPASPVPRPAPFLGDIVDFPTNDKLLVLPDILELSPVENPHTQ